MERFEGDFPKTTIVQKTVEDHKAVSHEHLGKSKNLGTGAHVDDGRTFGQPSVKVGSLSWNAGRNFSQQLNASMESHQRKSSSVTTTSAAAPKLGAEM